MPFLIFSLESAYETLDELASARAFNSSATQLVRTVDDIQRLRVYNQTFSAHFLKLRLSVRPCETM